MNLRPYLPSAQFVVMVGALALSGGLVLAAQYVTAPKQPSATSLSASQNQPAATNYDWQQALQDVENQSGIQAPTTPDQNTVDSLIAQAQSPNLTTTVGRTLLINLSNASSQGLGQDDPTQNQLISQAAAQINASASSTVYAQQDLAVVAPTNASIRAYGNGVMSILLNHPEASSQATFQSIGQASDAQNAAALAPLASIGQGYAAITHALLVLPVPQTLAPLHLQLVNDYEAMADSYAEMAHLVDDPLRGIAGVQRYSDTMDDAQRVLTNIGQTLNKDGILFSKDEPGTSWSAFLSQ